VRGAYVGHVALVLSLVLGCFAAPSAAVTVLGGTFPLPVGAHNETTWVTVNVGDSLSYNTTSTSYIAYTLQVDGGRVADGGDGGGFSGCLFSNHPFAARILWMNDDPLSARDSQIRFNMDVNRGSVGCTSVDDAVAVHDVDNQAPPGFGGFMLAIAIAAAATIGAIGLTVFLLIRHNAPQGKPSMDQAVGEPPRPPVA
jgi:hypothetical protein